MCNSPHNFLNCICYKSMKNWRLLSPCKPKGKQTELRCAGLPLAEATCICCLGGPWRCCLSTTWGSLWTRHTNFTPKTKTGGSGVCLCLTTVWGSCLVKKGTPEPGSLETLYQFRHPLGHSNTFCGKEILAYMVPLI